MTFTEIIADIRFLTGSTSASFPLSTLTASVNRAYDRAARLIMGADGRWQWDDSNNTDLPIATTSLVSGQQDYQLPVDDIKVHRLEVKDETDTWKLLSPIDEKDIFDSSMDEFESTDGLPAYYDKIGRSIFLYPTPSYSQSASLKVWFQRGPSYFTTSDTTKSPGFSALSHRLLSLWASYDYCLSQGIDRAKSLRQEIEIAERALVDEYSQRDKTERPRLATRRYNFS